MGKFATASSSLFVLCIIFSLITTISSFAPTQLLKNSPSQRHGGLPSLDCSSLLCFHNQSLNSQSSSSTLLFCKNDHDKLEPKLACPTIIGEDKSQCFQNFYTRRSLLQLTAVTATTTLANSIWPIHKANAASLLDGISGNKNNHRQLELCLVAVLRVLYWAQNLVNNLAGAFSVEEKKRLYLEARLGCKAALSGRLVSGANYRVYVLSTLQLSGCLKDLEYYANQESSQKSRQVYDLKRDFIEGIAAVVEFDGMDTLADPSPRTSLTINQYTNEKCEYVQRVLSEKVIRNGILLLQSFPESSLNKTKSYVQQFYSSEIVPIDQV